MALRGRPWGAGRTEPEARRRWDNRTTIAVVTGVRRRHSRRRHGRQAAAHAHRSGLSGCDLFVDHRDTPRRKARDPPWVPALVTQTRACGSWWPADRQLLPGAPKVAPQQRWGRRDSNPHCGRFKRPASADWATPPRRSGTTKDRPSPPSVPPVPAVTPDGDQPGPGPTFSHGHRPASWATPPSRKRSLWLSDVVTSSSTMVTLETSRPALRRPRGT